MKSHIKQIMTDKKKSVRELAALSGVSHDTIVRAGKDEQIETITLSTLAKIARALRVSVKELFDE